MSKLPKTSEDVCASTPSEEFPYTWVDLTKSEIGPFFRFLENAKKDASTNFHGFTIACNVIIVKAMTGILDKDD